MVPLLALALGGCPLGLAIFFLSVLIIYNSILPCVKFWRSLCVGEFLGCFNGLKHEKIVDIAWPDIRTSVIFVRWDLDPQFDQWHHQMREFFIFNLVRKFLGLGQVVAQLLKAILLAGNCI